MWFYFYLCKDFFEVGNFLCILRMTKFKRSSSHSRCFIFIRIPHMMHIKKYVLCDLSLKGIALAIVVFLKCCTFVQVLFFVCFLYKVKKWFGTIKWRICLLEKLFLCICNLPTLRQECRNLNQLYALNFWSLFYSKYSI